MDAAVGLQPQLWPGDPPALGPPVPGEPTLDGSQDPGVPMERNPAGLIMVFGVGFLEFISAAGTSSLGPFEGSSFRLLLSTAQWHVTLHIELAVRVWKPKQCVFGIAGGVAVRLNPLPSLLLGRTHPAAGRHVWAAPQSADSPRTDDRRGRASTFLNQYIQPWMSFFSA